MTAFKGLGTYGDGAGVVTPLDHKLGNAGMVAKASATTIRPGLFWGGTGTIVSGKANMSYDVAAYTCVTQRSAAAGAVFGGNDGTLNLTTDVGGSPIAAPGSNSAYHVVFHWHREFSLDGTDSNPVIAVVQGTSAASPTVPSLAAYPGAIELARILVPAGVTATNSGTTITQKAPFTAMDGGRIPFRNTTERDAGTYLEGQLGWLVDTDTSQVYLGSSWSSLAGGSYPIIPTSVAGTGVTVSSNGKVTFTSSSTVSVNGVFSSTYDSYEISISAPTHVASVATTMRLRLAGTDASVSNTYGSQRTYGNVSSVASANFNSTDWTIDAASGGTTVLNTLRLYLTNPGAASPTIGDAHFVNVISATNIFDGTVGLYHTASTAYDGFSIYVASGSMSGSLTVRGYNSQA